MISAIQQHYRVAVALTTCLLLAACAGGPLRPDVDFKQDYNFSQVKKVGFYAKSGQVSGDNKMQLSDIQKDRINTALTQALQQKGFELVSDASEADMLLSWHLVTQFKTDVQSYSTPGMYGYNRYAMYNCWSCMGGHFGGSEVVSSNYTEGTFIVDMIDPELRKSVWRGTIQSRLKDSQLKDQESYNAAALSIFAAFPPGSTAIDQ
ncbi:DUF4136 domain-containing protein [Parahaliea sp. F7430]|uniref:DUF4136 domain-containing protein n=1 Tax=Sediminihaliea albiluteola TaxID=2758564 RepID=A0A7W2YJQ3_9GAMM|nr:DUF4136 domain-containing protein [Sediminihaliea albiluteola]MBA6413317.1 DUF4136 domain-containing protein [Sediminihaliea albiluteola]